MPCESKDNHHLLDYQILFDERAVGVNNSMIGKENKRSHKLDMETNMRFNSLGLYIDILYKQCVFKHIFKCMKIHLSRMTPNFYIIIIFLVLLKNSP